MPDEGPREEPNEEPSEEPSEEPNEKPARDAGDGDDGSGLPSFDQLVGTFMEEASLWPVLAVALGSGGAFAATLLILAGVDRNPFAGVALLLLFGMTVDVLVRARRRPSYRNGARLLGLIWIVGLTFAGIALWTGIAQAKSPTNASAARSPERIAASNPAPPKWSPAQ